MQHETVISPPCAPRPRAEARRRAFLDAARMVFLEKGYANATLDDVIARSGGSRQTLYALFGGKEGLFKAIVEENGRNIFGPLGLEGLLGRPPDEALVELGIRYLQLVTGPLAVCLNRVLIAQGVTMNELARQYWAVGPGRNRTLVAAYLADQARRGVLRIDDPEDASDQFFGMLLGTHQLRCLLGLRGEAEPDEVARFVRSAVARFLDGCRAR